MGAEQSQNERANRQRSRCNNQQNYERNREEISREEVNILLEQQRKDYERKLEESQRAERARAALEHTRLAQEKLKAQELVRAQEAQLRAQAAELGRVAQETQKAQAASPKPPEHPMLGAGKAQEDRLASQIQQFLSIASSTATQAGHNASNNRSPQAMTSNTPSCMLERDRTPYRMTFTNGNSPNNLNPNLSTQNVYQKTQDYKPNPGSSNLSSEDYVFVNKNYVQNGTRPRPSAPSIPPERISKPKPVTQRSNLNRNEEGLNCITCGNKYGLTIFQCPNGHSSCRDCKINNALCGLCRNSITDVRNINLEAYVSERKSECPYAPDGCNLYLKLADIETHKKECPFRDFPCPITKTGGACRWNGKASQLAVHFDDNHPANRQGKIDTELTLINIVDDCRILHFVELGIYNFVVNFKVDNNLGKIFMAVQLMGTQMSATKWSYEIQVYNKGQPRRKFTSSDICNSYAVPVEEIYAESQCVVIPRDYASTFLNGGCLNYKFYIKKNDEPDAPSVNRGRGRGRGRGRRGDNKN